MSNYILFKKVTHLILTFSHYAPSDLSIHTNKTCYGIVILSHPIQDTALICFMQNLLTNVLMCLYKYMFI